MKPLQKILIGSLVVGVLFSDAASADHAAIVYCALDGGNVVVVATDYSVGGGVSSSARSGRPCAAVLHEIMQSGYEISNMDAPHVARPPDSKEPANVSGSSNDKSRPDSPNGLIVFMLKKPHK